MFHDLLPFDELLAVLLSVEQFEAVLDAGELLVIGWSAGHVGIITLCMIIVSGVEYLLTANEVINYPLNHHLYVFIFTYLPSFVLG